MSANNLTTVGNGRSGWRTPPDLFKTLDWRYCFDYDPFSSHENALCTLHSTVDGTYSGRNKLSDDDGLTRSWRRERIYMNPPYSRGLIEQCIEKAYNERNNASIIVALLPASTDTQWFQRFILPHCFIDWLPKRVRFIDPDTGLPGGSPPSGSIIALFRPEM